MPKTAGTTLKSIIGRNIDSSVNYHVYEPDQKREITLKQLSQKKVSCIQGHFPFGIHNYFNSPFTYITMLREPTQRIISEYYFIRSIPWHEQHEEVIKMSLDDYQKQTSKMNLQTRLISGSLDHPLTNIHLEQAKNNIEKYFSIVGITEMFNESLYLMKKRFGWNRTSYRKLNITKNKPQIEKLSPKTIAVINNNNHLDRELYHFAKQRLIKQLIHSGFKS